MRTTPLQAGGGRDWAGLVAEAKRSIAQGSRSFALASRLFDRDTRERVWLLYAWCRRCDDIADNQEGGGALGDQKHAEDRAQAIRVLTRRAFERQPTADPAFDGFGVVADECGISKELAGDVVSGFALDASGWRPKNERDLMRYCYHVAGAVGEMVALAMNVPEEEGDTLDRACDLGLAFQMANIARDIVEDDAAGRCYLPAEWLVEKDFAPGEHAKPAGRFVLASLMPRLIALMDKHAAAARLGAARLPFRQRWAVLTATRIYTAIGHKVLDRGQNAWNHRVVVSGSEKLWHMLAAFLEALVNRPEGPGVPITWTRHDFRPVAGW